jgi:hypothetical protein
MYYLPALSKWFLQVSVKFWTEFIHSNLSKVVFYLRVIRYKTLKWGFVRFCLFVCLFVPYTNPHFWTDHTQTLLTSPPWSGGDRRVRMDQQCDLLGLFGLFCPEPVPNLAQKLAADARVIGDSVLSVIPARDAVASRTWLCSRRHARSYWTCLALWIMHRKRWQVKGMHVCKNGTPDKTGSKWIMICNYRNICNCKYINNNLKPV